MIQKVNNLGFGSKNNTSKQTNNKKSHIGKIAGGALGVAASTYTTATYADQLAFYIRKSETLLEKIPKIFASGLVVGSGIILGLGIGVLVDKLIDKVKSSKTAPQSKATTTLNIKPPF